jgi:hypothetical protein
MASNRWGPTVKARRLLPSARRKGRLTVLDFYLPHFDAVLRHGVVIPARPDDTWAWLKRFDFAQMCGPVGRAVEDMRAVPRAIAEVAHRARQLSPTARFLLDDAPRSGFVLLSEDPRGHIVLGAVGKLWKPKIELLPLDREEFLQFHDAKYVKAAFAFVLRHYGRDRTALKHEFRFLATDDSARTHFRRFWAVAEPYAVFFMQRSLQALVQVAKEQQEAIAPPPPWRRRVRAK